MGFPLGFGLGVCGLGLTRLSSFRDSFKLVRLTLHEDAPTSEHPPPVPFRVGVATCGSFLEGTVFKAGEEPPSQPCFGDPMEANFVSAAGLNHG